MRPRALLPTRTHSLQIEQLNQGIATFYNESSELWESVWGEHMHHGAATCLLAAVCCQLHVHTATQS